MDTWNLTDYIIQVSQSFSSGDEIEYTWDNHTSHTIETSISTASSRNSRIYFIIAMSFLGGFVAGLLLHIIYSVIVRFVEAAEQRTNESNGVVNLSFVGDEPSRTLVNDHPPDYDTVMSSGDRSQTDARPVQGRGLLKRVFSRSKSCELSTSLSSSMEDPPPPSYSSAMRYLEEDLASRG